LEYLNTKTKGRLRRRNISNLCYYALSSSLKRNDGNHARILRAWHGRSRVTVLGRATDGLGNDVETTVLSEDLIRGVQNLNNMCYLNNVLQCLTYKLPLDKKFLKNQHSSLCKYRSHNYMYNLHICRAHIQNTRRSCFLCP
jgi:hypothetical protein